MAFRAAILLRHDCAATLLLHRLLPKCISIRALTNERAKCDVKFIQEIHLRKAYRASKSIPVKQA